VGAEEAPLTSAADARLRDGFGRGCGLAARRRSAASRASAAHGSMSSGLSCASSGGR
jgi:hypothetical protein